MRVYLPCGTTRVARPAPRQILQTLSYTICVSAACEFLHIGKPAPASQLYHHVSIVTRSRRHLLDMRRLAKRTGAVRTSYKSSISSRSSRSSRRRSSRSSRSSRSRPAAARLAYRRSFPLMPSQSTVSRRVNPPNSRRRATHPHRFLAHTPVPDAQDASVAEFAKGKAAVTLPDKRRRRRLTERIAVATPAVAQEGSLLEEAAERGGEEGGNAPNLRGLCRRACRVKQCNGPCNTHRVHTFLLSHRCKWSSRRAEPS